MRAYRFVTKDVRMLIPSDLGEVMIYRLGLVKFDDEESSHSHRDRLAAPREVHFTEFQSSFPFNQEPYVRFEKEQAAQNLFNFLKVS